MIRFVAHARSLWGGLWPLPGSVFPIYAVVMAAIGDLRPEHVAFAVLVFALAYAGPRSKSFLVDVSPYLIVALGYDLVRYARRVALAPDRVLGCELGVLDRALFPVGGGASIQDWLVAGTTPALDLIFALPYAVFAYVAFIYAAYLYFADRPRMRRFLWAFAIANYISFTCWLLVPAAPPWYVRAHGCAIDLSVAPSPAGLVRVDDLLGVGYFATFYSRAASVFGAMPSMHNAYPLLGLFTAWPSITWKTKPLHIAYFLLMFTASMYLDHHWVVDAVAGWLVALVAVILAPSVLRFVGADTPKRAAPQPACAE